jgi:hypothetical protein
MSDLPREIVDVLEGAPALEAPVELDHRVRRVIRAEAEGPVGRALAAGLTRLHAPDELWPRIQQAMGIESHQKVRLRLVQGGGLAAAAAAMLLWGPWREPIPTGVFSGARVVEGDAVGAGLMKGLANGMGGVLSGVRAGVRR